METTNRRSLAELNKIEKFEDKIRYLMTHNVVGEDTFGHQRYLNQMFYSSQEWKQFKNKMILRDNGCDLGMPGREIYGAVYLHHLNPITIEDIIRRNPCIMDPDNVICCSFSTHQQIHYGINPVDTQWKERTPYDTCPWRKT